MLHIEYLNNLFEEVQRSGIFPDSKTFVDAIPQEHIQAIGEQFDSQKTNPNFSIRKFVDAHFDIPENPTSNFESNMNRSVSEHIEVLWNYLEQKPQNNLPESSLIALPHSYIFPGGRFREVYYWDSYFTLLGLKVSHKNDLIESIVNNFAHLIHTIGFVPNGNRSYYLGRSQPPFFIKMVAVLAEIKGEEVWDTYLPAIEKEYDFWINGTEDLCSDMPAINRVVRLDHHEVLNRYWDNYDTPRPESFIEDIETASKASHVSAKNIYRHLRAAAESGWDFSSRWLLDMQHLESIRTTDIIPVDLNALIFGIEQQLADSYKHIDSDKANFYHTKATKRQALIHKYCWDESKGFYFDYDFVKKEQTHIFSLASIYPLFFGLASPKQATLVAQKLETDFLQVGGFVTTLHSSGQQWDSPNAWAPLQWLCYKGLINYGFHELAEKGKQHWLKNCETYYQQTGKMMEKYNAFALGITAKGGEYPNQDGFGWTNGVYLALKNS